MKIKFRCPSHIKVVVTFLFMVAFFSCSDQGMTEDSLTPAGRAAGSNTITPSSTPLDPLSNLTTVRSLYSTVYSSNFSRASSYVVADGSRMYVNYERLIRDEATKMNASFRLVQLSPRFFAREFQFNHRVPNTTLPSHVAGGPTGILSRPVLQLLDRHANLMYTATDAASAAAHYNATKNYLFSVIGITSDELKFLLGAIEAINEYAQKYFNGGGTQVYNAIQARTGATVSSGCSVNWRDVFAGAVVGGVVGAVRGGTIGAAGGTVTFPGLGTVTGALGGAVFGFATGFLGGALTGVAANMLTTCFRFEYYPVQPPDFTGTLCPVLTGCQYELQDYKLWYGPVVQN